MNIELAWAAGFFEGEGCVYIYTPKFGAPYPRLSIGQAASPYTLERFIRAVGVGRANGPYKFPNKNKKDYYLVSYGRAKSAIVMNLLEPYLSKECLKRLKYNTILAENRI